MKQHLDVHQIFEHLFVSKTLQSRFMYRMLPISLMCKASGNMEEFERQARPLVKNFIIMMRKEQLARSQAEGLDLDTGLYFTWCVEFKARNNGKIKRQEYIDVLLKLLKEDQEAAPTDDPLSKIPYSFSIDYKEGDFDFVIEVFRDLLMFSIVKEYK